MILRTKMTLTVSPFLLHILTRLGLQTKVHRSTRINKDSHSLLLYIMVSSSALAQGDGPLNATTSPVHRVSSPVRQRLNWSHRMPLRILRRMSWRTDVVSHMGLQTASRRTFPSGRQLYNFHSIVIYLNHTMTELISSYFRCHSFLRNYQHFICYFLEGFSAFEPMFFFST